MIDTTTTSAETAVSAPSLPRPNLKLVVTAGLLLAVFVGFLTYVQFGTDALAGNDGYYHIKMGWLMSREGLTPDFPYLPQTILNGDAFYDHHLLYHVYLAIFAAFAPDPASDGGAGLTLAAKIASILLPALAFMALWWLLRGQGVRFAAVWALGLTAVSAAFLYRMSMPRAQSASLLVLVLGLHWLLQGRYRRLLPLGFVYVWLYNAFPLLLVVAGVYVAASWLLERRFVWQAVVYPAVGIALGVIINPYFPEMSRLSSITCCPNSANRRRRWATSGIRMKRRRCCKIPVLRWRFLCWGFLVWAGERSEWIRRRWWCWERPCFLASYSFVPAGLWNTFLLLRCCLPL
ncbi:MAG: hypothetical protein IPH82_13125 [Chloroflexi bacterium]|nr:hypothetical protein [Chloroflexota bacterium]